MDTLNAVRRLISSVGAVYDIVDVDAPAEGPLYYWLHETELGGARMSPTR